MNDLIKSKYMYALSSSTGFIIIIRINRVLVLVVLFYFSWLYNEYLSRSRLVDYNKLYTTNSILFVKRFSGFLEWGGG